jgi:cellobiose-specific phosphotransferase system component IIB
MIIGIDPGKSGAVAVWDDGIEKVIKCPNNPDDMSAVIRLVKNQFISGKSKYLVAYMERVWARPSNATRAAFTFGVNYGEWLGILSTLNVDTVLVTPQTWMKYYKDKFKIKLPKEKKDRKNKLKKIAAQYTDKKVTLYNADAILIAVYGFIEQSK